MLTDAFDKDTAKVLTLFSVSPGSKFTRNEVKEKTMLYNVQLDMAINVLLQNRIIRKEKRLLQLNFEQENAKKMLDILKKEHLRFKELPLKIYFMLIDFSSSLNSVKMVRAAYLFGSYAKLIYTEKSDVDVAVIMEKEDKKSKDKVKEFAKKIEKKYGKELELHFYEEKDLRQKDPVIKEIAKNSVELFMT